MKKKMKKFRKSDSYNNLRLFWFGVFAFLMGFSFFTYLQVTDGNGVFDTREAMSLLLFFFSCVGFVLGFMFEDKDLWEEVEEERYYG